MSTDKELEDFMKRMIPSEEEMKEISKEVYNDELKNKNNFSYWYPKIIETPLNMAKSIYHKFSFEEREIIDTDYDKVDFKQIREMLKPVLSQMDVRKTYSVKYGTFSGKFNFEDSIATIENLEEKFYKVNYGAAMVGAGGDTEIVVREFIQYNNSVTPRIYNGLPLRPEFRVFYDMDKKKVLYIVNYWNYDYCRPHIYDRTDQIVFDGYKDYLGIKYMEYRDKVKELVSKSKFDLSGKWSIDVMLNEIEDKLYLIDMAEANKSAYYDAEKCEDE